MNDEEGLFSTRDSLPEEIRKNTVAMGKIHTHVLLPLYCSFTLYGVLLYFTNIRGDFTLLPSLVTCQNSCALRERSATARKEIVLDSSICSKRSGTTWK